MKIEKINKQLPPRLTFSDLNVGDLFRDASSDVIRMKLSMEPIRFKRSFNTMNLESNTLVHRARDEHVIRVDATLVEKE